eukprot:5366261-Pyramimonas_sp.AAC.1
MEDLVFLIVEHQVTFHFFIKSTRQCCEGHNRMPKLVPSSALPTCVADTCNEVESNIAQASLTEYESHLQLFRKESAQV